MGKITLYSTGCPNCKMLKMKLDQKGINYDVSDDFEEAIALGHRSAPLLKVDDEYMTFGNAIKWINNYNEQ